MNGFVRFMGSQTGRVVRVLAGALLIVLGVALGGVWWVLAGVGLVPLLAGAFDVCLFAPLFKAPMSGAAIRGEDD